MNNPRDNKLTIDTTNTNAQTDNLDPTASNPNNYIPADAEARFPEARYAEADVRSAEAEARSAEGTSAGTSSANSANESPIAGPSNGRSTRPSLKDNSQSDGSTSGGLDHPALVERYQNRYANGEHLGEASTDELEKFSDKAKPITAKINAEIRARMDSTGESFDQARAYVRATIGRFPEDLIAEDQHVVPVRPDIQDKIDQGASIEEARTYAWTTDSSLPAPRYALRPFAEATSAEGTSSRPSSSTSGGTSSSSSTNESLIAGPSNARSASPSADQVKDISDLYESKSPMDQFEVRSLFNIDAPILGDVFLSITNIALYLTIGGFIVFLVGLLSNNNNKLVPNTWSIALESIYATVHSIVVGQINEKNGQAYFPFMYVLFVFILFNNLIGLVPYSFASTGHFALTFSLSFTIVLGATILGFSIHGLKFFSLLVPAGCPLALLPLLVLIEFISYLARNVSLGLRLAANILSGHMLLNILSGFTYNIMTSGFIFFFLGLLPLAFIVAFSGLELGIAFIQAQVFVVLSCSYIKDGLDLH